MDIKNLKNLSSLLEENDINLYLFSVIELENYPNKFDLVIVSDNLRSGHLDDIKIVSNKLRIILKYDELLQISSIIILSKKDVFVSDLIYFIKEEPNPNRVRNFSIRGKDIKNCYTIKLPI